MCFICHLSINPGEGTFRRLGKTSYRPVHISCELKARDDFKRLCSVDFMVKKSLLLISEASEKTIRNIKAELSEIRRGYIE